MKHSPSLLLPANKYVSSVLQCLLYPFYGALEYCGQSLFFILLRIWIVSISSSQWQFESSYDIVAVCLIYYKIHECFLVFAFMSCFASGIYVGDGMVIHFTRAAGQEIGTGTILDRIIFSCSPSNVGASCEICGDQSMKQGVISSCVDCFLAGGDLYIFHYSVSPIFFIAKARGGTCTLAASDPTSDALHRAKYLLNNGFGMYSLFKNNCEDFAIYCKTGLLLVTSFSVGRSGQLTSLAAAVSAVAASPLRFMTTSAGGLTMVAGGMYCIGRYVSDIGVRRDVVKIPVERLVAESTPHEPETAPPAQANHWSTSGHLWISCWNVVSCLLSAMCISSSIEIETYRMLSKFLFLSCDGYVWIYWNIFNMKIYSINLFLMVL